MFKTLMLAPNVWESTPNRKHKYIANIKQYNNDEVQVQLHDGKYLVFEGFCYINNDNVLKKIVQLSNDYCAGRISLYNAYITSCFEYINEYHENGWQKQKYYKQDKKVLDNPLIV